MHTAFQHHSPISVLFFYYCMYHRNYPSLLQHLHLLTVLESFVMQSNSLEFVIYGLLLSTYSASLYHNYERSNYTSVSLLWIDFTQYDKFYSLNHKKHDLIFTHSLIVFYCVYVPGCFYVPCSFYLVICSWSLQLFPNFGYF